MQTSQTYSNYCYTKHSANCCTVCHYVQLVLKYFADMDRPMDMLSKQLWLILHRTIISVRMEPTIIVTVLRIIEREER